MNPLIRKALVALLVAVPAIATAQDAPMQADDTVSRGARCSVVDLDSFNAFIAEKPSVSQFKASYSCVELKLPGDVTTFEQRVDNSRYYAKVDEYGRIVGGRFG